MIMVGSWILSVGMRYGGMYEFEFEDDDV
jgi:hypothetical protein